MAECNCNNCQLIPRVERLEQDMQRNSETHSKMYEDINELKQGKVVNLEKISATLEKVEKIEEKMDHISTQLGQLSSAPAKNWEVVVRSSITAVIGALVGAFMMLALK